MSPPHRRRGFGLADSYQLSTLSYRDSSEDGEEIVLPILSLKGTHVRTFSVWVYNRVYNRPCSTYAVSSCTEGLMPRFKIHGEITVTKVYQIDDLETDGGSPTVIGTIMNELPHLDGTVVDYDTSGLVIEEVGE